ncbi:MAG: DUF86 domain-containing protein [Taibaiella sp.]|nr:DUF86 domain-containing protein [Taibaiella sp.]
MSSRNPILLLEDILNSADKILRYTEGMTYATFIEDERTLDAVIRNFEIIGEASNRLPEELREQHIAVDWHKVRGFRNRIVHDYMGIDYAIVWNVITDFLPGLAKQVSDVRSKIQS